MNTPRFNIGDEPFAGPPPAGPPMCYACVTGLCHHESKLADAHGSGFVPAVTYLSGTAYCQDCAQLAASALRDLGPSGD